MREILTDTGASVAYVSTRLCGLKTIKVKAGTVNVAEEDTHVVDWITTVDVKLGNLPVETFKAYEFMSDGRRESTEIEH
jgi:hypothetical protein